mgnify:CR=1 FL=1
MKKNLYLSLLILILLPPSFLPASGNSTEFESWITNKHFFPDQSHIEKAKKYRYFFVTGFMNEILKGGLSEYFYDNIKELSHRGIPESNLYRPIYLSSSRTAEENAEDLYKIILEQAPGDQKDLVLIGHSMGAQELFLMSLKQRDFIKNRVRAVFLIQGSIGGSPIADYVAGEAGEGTLDKLSLWERWRFQFLMRSGSALRMVVQEGLHSLTRKNAKSFWSHIQLSDEDRQLLNLHLFYILSKMGPDKISDNPIFSISGRYTLLNFGENDGLLLVEDQMTSRFGTQLALLTADHCDLVLSLNPMTRQMRKGLMRAMIQWVGK